MYSYSLHWCNATGASQEQWIFLKYSNPIIIIFHKIILYIFLQHWQPDFYSFNISLSFIFGKRPFWLSGQNELQHIENESQGE